MKHSTYNQQGQGTTQRAFLKQVLALTGVSAGAALFSACGAATAPSSTAPASTTAAANTTAAATTGQDATSTIVAAANAFLATLDETQRTAVSFPYPSDQNTASAVELSGGGPMTFVGEQFGASVWSNFPLSDVPRPGVRLGDLTTAQRQAALALLAATLSQQGYQKVLDIMHADQVLADSGTPYQAGTDNYVLGIFGPPSVNTRWMWQFGGHHLALNATIQGPALTLAPMLTGCQPATYTLRWEGAATGRHPRSAFACRPTSAVA